MLKMSAKPSGFSIARQSRRSIKRKTPCPDFPTTHALEGRPLCRPNHNGTERRPFLQNKCAPNKNALSDSPTTRALKGRPSLPAAAGGGQNKIGRGSARPPQTNETQK